MAKRNPFVYGRELTRDELADRADELAHVRKAIANRDRLFLIGPRRYGKTSVLAVAAEAARRDGVIVLRVDAEKYETLELLAQAVVTEAARALQGPVDKVARLIGRVAASLRPQVTVDSATGSIAVGLGVQAPETGEGTMLAEALDAVDRLVGEAGCEVAVMLDEVQQVVVDGGLNAERQLRAAVQQHQHTSYVLSGSDTRLLTEMTQEPNRPFYRLGSRLHLGEIPEAEFLAFLDQHFLRTGVRIRGDACAAILALAESVPYSVQRLAHEVWEQLRGSGAHTLTEGRVHAALQMIVQREDPFYTQLWIGLSRNQKRALKATAEQDGTELLGAATSRKYRIPASSMQAALKSLAERQLVRPDPSAGRARFCLVDPFVRAWLRWAQPTGRA